MHCRWMSLVKSSQNKADWLTRVPQRWLDAIKRNTGPVQPSCTASMSSFGLDQFKIAHLQSSHPGVQQTLYFVRQIAPGISKATVKTVVRECEDCQPIDPAPMHWSKGALNVKQTWHRVIFFYGDRLRPRSICHLMTPSLTRCDECNQLAEGALLWAGSASRDSDR